MIEYAARELFYFTSSMTSEVDELHLAAGGTICMHSIIPPFTNIQEVFFLYPDCFCNLPLVN